jgi:hypothetical protein
MPINPPLRASGSRELNRPRPIPKAVRDAITLMVYGKIEDPDCAPVDFITAAKLSGIKPDVMRRWLDRAPVRALLRSERRAFREAICAGNEAALQRVRDKSANGMVTVAAVRALEQIDEVDSMHRRGPQESPHVTIRILNVQPSPAPNPETIEHSPAPELEPAVPKRDADGFLVDRDGRRVFDPFRNGGLLSRLRVMVDECSNSWGFHASAPWWRAAWDASGMRPRLSRCRLALPEPAPAADAPAAFPESMRGIRCAIGRRD